MKHILFLLSFVILYSCKTDSKAELKAGSEESFAYDMYGLLIEEFNANNEIMKEQISDILYNKNLIEDNNAKIYDSLTTQYVAYLDNTYSELINHPKTDPSYYGGELSKIEYTNNFFFNGEDYSETGTEFISKMDNYRTEILKLVKDQNLKRRINNMLTTTLDSSIRTRDGQLIKALDYFYKDMPLISVLTRIKNKERSILEFENDFLKNLLINK
ncbi:hypothetical protein [Bizionia arctica]|uniref:Gliding motility-associated protein GldM N-terminal domain-containing protein n=1 Tax=Bizionia arctica TaxID=1495645 RepID=A0A917GIG1_9FLAO|nr:hypothetical protein [Bizionia arctica]GGG46679.1 hypothetical protein GCM10010976_17680 [Bizionia arctica]